LEEILSSSLTKPRLNHKIFCSLFCFCFGFQPVESIHLAIIAHVSHQNQQDQISIVCEWLSEPILAEVFACITSKLDEDNKYKMLAVV
jgi:hypothetical protein